MSLLLDTSVAVALRERHEGTLDRLEAASAVPAISLLTMVELEGGVTGPPDERARRRKALDALFEEVDVLAFDISITAVYRDILATLGFSRRRIIDRLIAATAIIHNLTLVTTNGADFRDIPGLKLEVWPTAQ